MIKLSYINLSVNECELKEDICGSGVCVDQANDDGLYSCDCDAGYEETGDPATLSQTCTGRQRRDTLKLRVELYYTHIHSAAVYSKNHLEDPFLY